MHRPRRYRIGSGVALGLLSVLLLAPVGVWGSSVAPGTSASSAHGSPFLNITYRSSVDRFPLSYDEWLPAGYTPEHPWPLVVFLHGIGNSTIPVPGGISNFLTMLSTPTFDGNAARSLIRNASAEGFIFVSLNTRSLEGFYADTPCGGPQQTDVLDAIAHERHLRSISSVYLIGFSMGAIGAFEIAGHFPGMIRGIAAAAPASDLYEEFAYLSTDRFSGSSGSRIVGAMETDECGASPSPTNVSVDASFYSYLSVARFAPQNFSNVSVWVSSGGLDTSIPNDATIWPYLEVNESFLTSTCHGVRGLGEPANCTTTWPNLHAANPGAFLFRDLYEPGGIHDVAQLDPADIFEFFEGAVPGGYVHSSFPPDRILLGP